MTTIQRQTGFMTSMVNVTIFGIEFKCNILEFNSNVEEVNFMDLNYDSYDGPPIFDEIKSFSDFAVDGCDGPPIYTNKLDADKFQDLGDDSYDGPLIFKLASRKMLLKSGLKSSICWKRIMIERYIT